MDEDRLDCAVCRDLYRGDPPCGTCALAEWEPEPEVARAWGLWRQLDLFSRPQGLGPAPLPLEAVYRACWAEDETEAVYRWILNIETWAFETRLKQHQTNRTDHGQLPTATERQPP